jgi:hypothetical protein
MIMNRLKKAVVLATASCVGALALGGTATAVDSAPTHHVAVQKHPKKHHKRKHHKKHKGMHKGSTGMHTGPSAAPSPAPGAGPNGRDLSRVIWPG